MSFLTQISILILVAFWSPAWGQQAPASTNPPPGPADLRGDWLLYLTASDAAAPPPPPIYASYRSKDDRTLDSQARVRLEVEQEALTGTAVIPRELPMEQPWPDLTGREAAVLQDLTLEGEQLHFKAESGSERIEITLTRQRRHFTGEWKTLSGQSGKAYLYRWPLGPASQ